jgi:hypothetical protein
MTVENGSALRDAGETGIDRFHSIFRDEFTNAYYEA